jgi:multisubunit Na+/H+ antiporter MnhF subunit
VSGFLLWTCTLCLVALFFSAALCLYRMAIGPTAADRAVALDTLSTVFIGIICVITIEWFLMGYHGATVYYDAVWILTLVGFIGSAAIAKYLHRGRLF